MQHKIFLGGVEDWSDYSKVVTDTLNTISGHKGSRGMTPWGVLTFRGVDMHIEVERIDTGLGIFKGYWLMMDGDRSTQLTADQQQELFDIIEQDLAIMRELAEAIQKERNAETEVSGGLRSYLSTFIGRPLNTVQEV